MSHPFARLSAVLVAGASATILVSIVALAVTAGLPDTALEMPSGDGVLIGVVVFLGAITVTADRLGTVRR